jgi:hypothetical protein
MVTEEKFEKVKLQAEQEYKEIGKVKCPYFNDYVHFNTEGFDHILFKSWNKPRLREEQYVRLKLLPLTIKAYCQFPHSSGV